MSSDVRVERPTILNLDSTKGKHRVSFCDRQQDGGAQKRFQPQRRNTYRETEYRSKRKRASSCSFQFDAKRRKSAMVLPSKFLLGGSITDPLNLEALDSDEENSANNRIPTCGPVNTVNVIIAPNINDPLNLDACSEDGEEELAKAIRQQILAAKKKKQRKRKRRNSEPTSVPAVPAIPAACDPHSRLSSSLDERDAHSNASEQAIHSLKTSLDLGKEGLNKEINEKIDNEDNKEKKVVPVLPITYIRQVSCPVMTSSEDRNSSSNPPSQLARPCPPKRPRHSSEDKIVSPVIPQPGASKNCQKQRVYPNASQKQPAQPEDFKIVSPVVHQPGASKQRSYNSGSNASQKLTQQQLQPPENFNPKNAQFQFGNYNQYYGYRNPSHAGDIRLQFLKPEWFAGKRVLDIGCNIGHITLSIARDMHPANVIGLDIDKALIKVAKKNIRHYTKPDEESDRFPASMKTLYGPLKPPVNECGIKKFPYNVKFFQANYVLENDALLETVRPEFDAILCLSVTKWIHLNWGDKGIHRFFKRIYANLNPGGILIFEPQSWQSYRKKRKLTPQIFNNYKSIDLFPDKFGAYLTMELGFEVEQKIIVPPHHSRGFQRPIYIYRKGVAISSGQSTPNLIASILSEHRMKCSPITAPDSSPKIEALSENVGGAAPRTSVESDLMVVNKSPILDSLTGVSSLDSKSPAKNRLPNVDSSNTKSSTDSKRVNTYTIEAKSPNEMALTISSSTESNKVKSIPALESNKHSVDSTFNSAVSDRTGAEMVSAKTLASTDSKAVKNELIIVSTNLDSASNEQSAAFSYSTEVDSSTILNPSTMDFKAPLSDCLDSKVYPKAPCSDFSDSKVDSKAPLSDYSDSEVDSKAPLSDSSDSKVDSKAPLLDSTDLKFNSKAPLSDFCDSYVDSRAPLSVSCNSRVDSKAQLSDSCDSNADSKAALSDSSDSKVDLKAPLSDSSESKVDSKAYLSDSSESKVDSKAPLSDSSVTKVDLKAPLSDSFESKVDSKASLSNSSDSKVDSRAPSSDSSDSTAPLSDSSESKVDSKDPLSNSSDSKVESKAPLMDTFDSKLIDTSVMYCKGLPLTFVPAYLPKIDFSSLANSRFNPLAFVDQSGDNSGEISKYCLDKSATHDSALSINKQQSCDTFPCVQEINSVPQNPVSMDSSKTYTNKSTTHESALSITKQQSSDTFTCVQETNNVPQNPSSIDSFHGTNKLSSITSDKKRKNVEIDGGSDEIGVKSPSKKCKL